jgi:ArsR family transcriptional regulator
MTAVFPKPRSQKVPPKTLPVSLRGNGRARGSQIKVSDRTIEGLTDIFNMLADRSRLKILLALAQDGELHVSALCALLEQSQPAVSHHLTLLRMRNLVAYRRDGKHNYYRIDSALVNGLLEQFFTDTGNGHKQISFDDFSLVYKRK